MDLALAIIFVITSAWIVQWLVKNLGGEGHQPIDFWTALGSLFLARYAVKGLLWLLPTLDLPVRVAVSLGFYLLVLTGLLMLYSKVRPLRALLIAAIISVVMTMRAILLVLGM